MTNILLGVKKKKINDLKQKKKYFVTIDRDDF